MTAIKYIFKLILKLFTLPLILLLRIAMLIAKLTGTLGSYILSPIMLFIRGCGIYCFVKTRWTDVAILFSMEACIWLLTFGGVCLYATAGDICAGLAAFLHS